MQLKMPISLGNLLKKKILLAISQGRGSRLWLINKIIKTHLQQWVFSGAGKLGLKIVTSQEIFNDSEKYNLLQFDNEETIVLSEPHSGSDELQAITNIIGTCKLKKPFVFEVQNAELFGSVAIGFNQEGSIISEIVTATPGSLKRSVPSRTLILKNLPSRKTFQLDTACSLVTPWSAGYYHWIVDALPRIEGCEYYQEQTGRKPTLIIHPDPPEWQKESLRLLGYDPDDCVQWNKSRIKVKRLVVPSFRRKYSITSPAACQWLRQRAYNNLPSTESKNVSFSPRIYISRTKAMGRNIINEDEVLAVLSPLGFVAYELEKLSFADKIRLFAQAEIVVAPHGAGLTHIVFGNNLSVIELFGSFGTPLFFALAKGLGFQYGCLGPNLIGTNASEKYNGIRVNVYKLLALVKGMLEISA